MRQAKFKWPKAVNIDSHHLIVKISYYHINCFLLLAIKVTQIFCIQFVVILNMYVIRLYANRLYTDCLGKTINKFWFLLSLQPPNRRRIISPSSWPAAWEPGPDKTEMNCCHQSVLLRQLDSGSDRIKTFNSDKLSLWMSKLGQIYMYMIFFLFIHSLTINGRYPGSDC